MFGKIDSSPHATADRHTNMASGLSVVALLAAYNEADLVGDVVRDLITQGVDVYFLDDGSSDRTLEVVEPLLGRGVIAIERLPRSPGLRDGFDWAGILRRKAELAREIEADWFIHQDADEFRESPWQDLTLKQAIERVDRAGYNAIDFLSLDFWPVDEGWQESTDIRQAFQYYSERAPYDRLQIRCWKRGTLTVDLETSGGHEAVFEGRTVFPIRFLSRHYPIRGQAHGERKIFRDRVPRYLAEELARGWHVQYDRTGPYDSLVRDRSTLTRFDDEAVRMSLLVNHRGTEALQDGLKDLASQLEAAKTETGRLQEDLAVLQRENAALHGQVSALQTQHEAALLELRTLTAERDGLKEATDALRTDLKEARHESTALAAECGQLGHAITQARAEQAAIEAVHKQVRHRLDEVLQSRSWRWTGPLRTVCSILLDLRR